MGTLIRTYTELSRLPTFKERYDYLRLGGVVCDKTFGIERYLNQNFYRGCKWRDVRDLVIIRDNGCDLGVEGYDIPRRIIIHHMNPISIEDLENDDPKIYDPEFLICVSERTHNAIHYGDETQLPKVYVPRSPGDTCPWLRKDRT